MYSLLRVLPLRRVLAEQVPALAVSALIQLTARRMGAAAGRASLPR